MFFLHPRHSPHHHSQLLHPSLAYMLAHSNEDATRVKCHSGTKEAQQQQSPAGPCQKETASNRSYYSNGHMHVSEEEDRFLLYTDLPGVKAQDLKVELTDKGVLRIQGERKRRGGAPMPFIRQFLVDDKLIESSNLTATFSDGSLEIVAPKKQPAEPRKVEVVAGSAPSTDNDMTFESFDLDVPGVNIKSLRVTVDSDGKLVVSGERKRGGKAVPIHRTFGMDTDVVDPEKLEAFLEDGVLTVRVPTKAPRVGRVIQVNAGDGEETEVKEESKAEKHTNQDAEAVVRDSKSGDHEAEDAASNDTEKSETEKELEFEIVPETVTEED